MNYWQQKIVEAQDKIKESESGNFYSTKYSKDEVYYWYYIPPMIYFDSLKNQVSSCLDIGAGFGTLSLYASEMYKCPVIMYDKFNIPSNNFLKKNKLGFKQGDIELDKELFNVEFDRIIFSECLEHLRFHPSIALKKIEKLLSENGFLYLSTPDANSWGRITKYYKHVGEMPHKPYKAPDVDEHVYQWTEGELLRLFYENNLEVVEEHLSQPPYWGKHFNYKLRFI